MQCLRRKTCPLSDSGLVIVLREPQPPRRIDPVRAPGLGDVGSRENAQQWFSTGRHSTVVVRVERGSVAAHHDSALCGRADRSGRSGARLGVELPLYSPRSNARPRRTPGQAVGIARAALCSARGNGGEQSVRRRYHALPGWRGRLQTWISAYAWALSRFDIRVPRSWRAGGGRASGRLRGRGPWSSPCCTVTALPGTVDAIAGGGG